MKPNTTPENDEPLGKVLRQWTVAAPLPPRFQEHVWKRIERAEAKAQPAPRLGLSRLLGVVLPRPKFASAYLAVFLAMGLAAGAVAAQLKASHLDSQLSQRYVQLLDPFQAGPAQP